MFSIQHYFCNSVRIQYVFLNIYQNCFCFKIFTNTYDSEFYSILRKIKCVHRCCTSNMNTVNISLLSHVHTWATRSNFCILQHAAPTKLLYVALCCNLFLLQATKVAICFVFPFFEKNMSNKRQHIVTKLKVAYLWTYC